MQTVCLIIVGAPLIGALIAGLGGRQLGRAGAHWVTITSVALSFLFSLIILKEIVIDGRPAFNTSVYTWLAIEGIHLEIGFLVDSLTALMITTVTFVSLMVHIYTVGYMHDDDGYQRFFSYIAFFTFAMLMLVMANNFLQLFFGWEAVGLASYLLIGFWYQRPSAIQANFKAFLVNRVGDFGFLLGIAAVLMFFNSLDYQDVFTAAPLLKDATFYLSPDFSVSAITLVCVLLFIGAMGKSAQVPLHVWLPDSMEGPTPISALIHAATMVTAGIFMVARMSPLYELSPTALSIVLMIGAITALSMGLLGIVQNDIKRVIAYSTLSQLGYMTVALGVSAYSAAIFHLFTHAFFKALLFLGAGSVIIAMHHEQDIRKMGGLRRLMPITWITFLIGTLSLVGTPGLSGFYSKDIIIEATQLARIPGAGFAYFAVLLGVFITSLYSFRLYFLVFHGIPRMDQHTYEHIHESPWVITGPLIALAIPSIIIGAVTVQPLLFGTVFEGAIHIHSQEHDIMGQHFHGAFNFALQGLQTKAFWLAIGGAIAAWYLYYQNPHWAESISQRLRIVKTILDRKYGFDDFNQSLAQNSHRFGEQLARRGDGFFIDGLLVNGSAYAINRWANLVRRIQSGYLYHYAFTTILGLLGFLTWMIWV